MGTLIHFVLEMFRNQYDNDVTVWSPQGRIHQVEYAMEAVKQGSATIGLKSKTHAVIVALKRASSELSAYQKKIIPIDTHMGMTIAGLTADARFLSRYMRSECLNHRFSYDEPHPVSTLISKLGNKLQVCTQSYDRRPYGDCLLLVMMTKDLIFIRPARLPRISIAKLWPSELGSISPYLFGKALE